MGKVSWLPLQYTHACPHYVPAFLKNALPVIYNLYLKNAILGGSEEMEQDSKKSLQYTHYIHTYSLHLTHQKTFAPLSPNIPELNCPKLKYFSTMRMRIVRLTLTTRK